MHIYKKSWNNKYLSQNKFKSHMKNPFMLQSFWIFNISLAVWRVFDEGLKPTLLTRVWNSWRNQQLSTIFTCSGDIDAQLAQRGTKSAKKTSSSAHDLSFWLFWVVFSFLFWPHLKVTAEIVTRPISRGFLFSKLVFQFWRGCAESSLAFLLRADRSATQCALLLLRPIGFKVFDVRFRGLLPTFGPPPYVGGGSFFSLGIFKRNQGNGRTKKPRRCEKKLRSAF